MQKKISLSAALVLIALISTLLLTDHFASPATHQDTIASIDAKIQNVKGLTAGSAVLSAAVSALPDDTATPIAEKLADISSYFVIVLCALYLEKYLITLTGFALFRILIPIACVLMMFSLFRNPHRLRKAAAKILVFGIILFALVPVSVRISDMIYETYSYELSDSSDLDDSVGDGTPAAEEEKTGFVGMITSGINDKLEEYTGKMNSYLQKFAIMLVTSCLIPLIVFFFFLWIAKMVMGIDKNQEISHKLDKLLKAGNPES